MDGNQRYSWTKKKRSPLVSRTLPRLFRCNTISCCRSVAISASSRAFDLNGETKMARTNQRSPITRSAYAIRSPSQRDEVFGTHSLLVLQLVHASLSRVIASITGRLLKGREIRERRAIEGGRDPNRTTISILRPHQFQVGR